MRNRMVLAASLLSLGACSPDEGRREYRTAHATIDTTFDEPLCVADLALVDRHVEEIAARLGVEPPRVDIIFTTALPVEGCQRGSHGCFHDGLVRARPESLRHELVHALAVEVGAPEKFWLEGLAVALEDQFLRRGVDSVQTALRSRTSGELDYRTAGHFSRWLIETHGMDRYLAVYGGQSVDEVYGASIGELASAYETDAPWAFPSATRCTAPSLHFGPGEVLDAEVASSCEHGGHRMLESLSFSVQTLRTIVVPVDGVYALHLGGGYGMDILRCLPPSVTDEPAEEMSGDVYTEAAILPPESFYLSETDHLVELEAGPHEVVFFASPGVDEETLHVQLALAPPE